MLIHRLTSQNPINFSCTHFLDLFPPKTSEQCCQQRYHLCCCHEGSMNFIKIFFPLKFRTGVGAFFVVPTRLDQQKKGSGPNGTSHRGSITFDVWHMTESRGEFGAKGLAGVWDVTTRGNILILWNKFTWVSFFKYYLSLLMATMFCLSLRCRKMFSLQ